jgi:hypothetical protein
VITKQKNNIKIIGKKIGKIFLGIVAALVAVLFILCIVISIPAVQTYLAQKAAGFLSEKLQTEVSIGKLRIDFNLNIQLEQLCLNDQQGNNLISAKKGSLSFPSFNTGTANVEICNIILDEADVTLRRYESDTTLNMQFFIDFLRPKEKREEPVVVDLRKIQLKNSRFQWRKDIAAGEDRDGVWNYSNMIIENINLRLHQLLIIGDSLNFYIDQLSAKERSGFQIDKFSGHLIVCRSGIHCLETNFSTKNKSDIAVDFRFDYTNFSDFSNFNTAIVFNTALHKGDLNMNDLVYFVPAFKGMNNMVHIAATIQGPLSDFKIKNLNLTFGQATEVKGSVVLNGLPDIEETFIDCNIENLKTNLPDLAAFLLPKNKTIPIPAMLKKLKWVQTQGHFLGLYNNFFADADFTTAIGSVSCELMLNNRSSLIAYDGKLQAKNVAIGQLFDQEDIGAITMQGHIKGEGIAIDDLNFQVETTVADIVYKNKTIKNIHIAGDFLSKQFEGQISCDDDDFNLDFNGLIDFNQQEPNYNFEANIRSINISNFQFFRPDSNVIVAAAININLSGKDIEHIHGRLTMENISYQENGVVYLVPDFTLRIQQEQYPHKNIHCTSDLFQVSMAGTFTYEQAFAAIQKNLHDQLSHLIPEPILDSTHEIFNQQFDLSLHLYKPFPLLNHFFPAFAVNQGVTVSISIDQSKAAGDISIEIPQVDINNKHRLNNLILTNQQRFQTFNFGITCSSYYLQKTDSLPLVQEFDFQAAVTDNVVDFLLTAAGNQSNKIQDILIEGSVNFLNRLPEIEITLNNGSLLLDKETFLLDTFNAVYLKKDSIYVRNFGLSSQKGTSLSIHSGDSEKEENGIFFNFNKIDLEIMNVFLNPYHIALDGISTGRGRLVRNGYGYALGSVFEVDDFRFNDVPMGFFRGRTFWNNIERKLFMQAAVFENSENQKDSLFVIYGNFDPKNKYIDLVGNINNLNIKILEPYLRSFASKVEGVGNGKVTFKGPIANPKLEGTMQIQKAAIGIDFLKTDYFIEQGWIDFVDTGFIFNHIPFKDNANGTGYVDGIITHNRLRDFALDLNITASNLSVLNTTAKDNNLFYGKAFATGHASIAGNVNNIAINADLATNRLTDISLSLDWTMTATESHFISFVAPETAPAKDLLLKRNNANASIRVNLNITATPDATVRVLLDPSIGGTIIGKGNGAVELVLDENNDFSLYGAYTLAGGEFNLAYGDVLTRTFKLENGGTIAWNGNPTQGAMNVQAVQAAKISVNNLFEHEDDKKRRPIAVNNILTLSGQLISPAFAFTFTLPDADEITRSKIYSAIDTTNREEMIRQMVNVLFFGKFELSSDNTSTGAINSGIGYSISELISYQLNRFVSTVTQQNIDVRVAYRPGEDAAENEYSVDIGGSFLNNKLVISTSLGIVEQQDVKTQDRFLGDVTVEYKLIPDGSLRIKAFNVTNQQDILQSTASSAAKYSQGIGLSYSKDFDRIRDLLIRKPRKKIKNQPHLP